jgi:hypothetical protein
MTLGDHRQEIEKKEKEQLTRLDWDVNPGYCSTKSISDPVVMYLTYVEFLVYATTHIQICLNLTYQYPFVAVQKALPNKTFKILGKVALENSTAVQW